MTKTINLKKDPYGCHQSQLISVKVNDVEKVRMTVTPTGCIIVHAACPIFFLERYHYKVEFKKPTTPK